MIAAVNGAAAGGGFALVLGSDVRLAAESAKFSAAFIKIGLSACDIGTSWLLPRLIGAARSQELMLTGRVFSSEEAERIGLVIERVADDRLLDLALAKAELIMSNTPFGVALTKEGDVDGPRDPGHAGGDRPREPSADHGRRATADHREAMKAFLEKRPPVFRNA